jgi:cytoskeletal protein CcmA (bactofilin family)
MSLFTTDQVNIQNVSVLTTQTATVEGALAVNGGASITGATSITGALAVNGGASITGATSITGALSASGKVAGLSASAPAAVGAQAIQIGSTATLGIYVCTGAPTVAAAKGSLCIRTDGANASEILYAYDGAAWSAFANP